MHVTDKTPSITTTSHRRQSTTYRRIAFAMLLCGCAAPVCFAADRSNVDKSLQAVLAVSDEGKGNAAAKAAWEQLASQDAYAVPELLTALDKANPLAANYIRSAIDAIIERSLRDKTPLPTAELETFLRTPSHNPRARRLAYEVLAAADPKVKEQWIPNLLLDPSPELRRDAVTYWLTTAQETLAKGKEQEAKPIFEKALSGAVDEDQVKDIAQQLSKLGEKVDIATHLGLILNWKIIGPFDNTEGKGFDTAYPPEEKVDFAGKYPGKHGEVEWKDYASSDDKGYVNLNKAYTQEKDVVAYCASIFKLPEARHVNIRFGTPNGWKVWVNGKPVFGRAEYHSGENFDQYSYDVDLKAGENVILFKCLQNNQTESWATDWRFRLRICDPSGTAVIASNRPVIATTPSTEEEP